MVAMPVDIGIGVLSTAYATFLAWQTISSRSIPSIETLPSANDHLPSVQSSFRPPAVTEAHVSNESADAESHPIEESESHRRRRVK